MGLWSSLFGSDNVIKKAADGIYNGVDKAIFTDEEKATRFMSLLKLYEPFKLAQRLLALSVTLPYVVVWLLCACMLVFSGFVEPGYGEQVSEAARALGELNNDTLARPVTLVLSFYFAGGVLEGVVSKIRTKP
ncbi:hypothetical protein [Larsenimonas suaedae]|uniref:Uncharacterized protein n=1 Tax=Larsenimonas suaedae TaxID=1851019 RepID=A0ABU1H0Y3_9GAMM|nr:hypothetical protein [Larsenimonas suaedae]MCM2973788.1 hypothetical protein [Larsenimonas suaedae]MDR5897312.1 hypothetical protein [Larsenimonas suaedae]